MKVRYARLGVLVLLVCLGLSACRSGGDGGSDPALVQDEAAPGGQAAEDVGASRPAWYKGDLHAHSTYSDGDSDVATVLQLAENAGLDFFVLTDHNTNAQWADAAYAQGLYDLTLLYGVEWTTDEGHANIWSDLPFDWPGIRSQSMGEPVDEWTMTGGDAAAAIALAHALAAPGREVLFSLNHPSCTLYSWDYSYADSRQADCIEGWNAGYDWPNLNGQAMGAGLVPSFFDRYVAAGFERGFRYTLVGGSDSHKHSANLSGTSWFETHFNNVGTPTTWVWADSRSGSDILRGIKAGHVFISRSPAAPQLHLVADADDNSLDYELMMGDTIKLAADQSRPVRFKARVYGAKPNVASWVRVIKNGKPFYAANFSLASDYTVDFSDTVEPGDYYRVELKQRPSADELLGNRLQNWTAAVTNPIYTW